jgi:hypothetical protein
MWAIRNWATSKTVPATMSYDIDIISKLIGIVPVTTPAAVTHLEAGS